MTITEYMDTCVAVRARTWYCVELSGTAAKITQLTRQAKLD